MSLLNITVNPNRQRAIVAADTLAGGVGDGATHVTKLFAVPHLNAVIGGCGCAYLLHSVFLAATMLQSVEECREAVPQLLATARETFSAMTRGVEVSPLMRRQLSETSIAIVGYSRGTISATVWNGFDDPAYAVHDIVGSYLNPAVSLADIGGHDPLSALEMESVARLQVSMYRGTREGAELGGRLLAAEVTELGITIREIADLERGIEERG